MWNTVFIPSLTPPLRLGKYIGSAAAGLVADRERLGDLAEPVDHLGPGAGDQFSFYDLAVAVKDAHRRPPGVNIESDVQHASLRLV